VVSKRFPIVLGDCCRERAKRCGLVMESIFIGEVSELNSVVWVLALAGPRLFNLRVCQLCGLISGLLSRCEWEGAIIENVRPVWSHCESMVTVFSM